MEEEEKLVTIKTFNLPADIPIVQSFLETEGIQVFVKNLTTHRLIGPICDIEMQVKSSDYLLAKRALIEGGFSKDEDFTT